MALLKRKYFLLSLLLLINQFKLLNLVSADPKNRKTDLSKEKEEKEDEKEIEEEKENEKEKEKEKEIEEEKEKEKEKEIKEEKENEKEKEKEKEIEEEKENEKEIEEEKENEKEKEKEKEIKEEKEKEKEKEKENEKEIEEEKEKKKEKEKEKEQLTEKNSTENISPFDLYDGCENIQPTYGIREDCINYLKNFGEKKCCYMTINYKYNEFNLCIRIAKDKDEIKKRIKKIEDEYEGCESVNIDCHSNFIELAKYSLLFLLLFVL